MWVTIGSGEAGGVTVRVEGERFVVGSAPESHLIVRDERVEPLHAYFETRPDGRVVLHDLGSSEGTLVNGERITEPALLQGDEEIRVGDTVLVASVADPAVEARLAGAGEEAGAEAAEGGGRPPDGSVAERTNGATRGEPPSEERPPLPVVPLPSDAPPQPVAARERRRLTGWARRAMVFGAVGAILGAAGIAISLARVLGGDEDPGASLASVVRAARPSTVLVSAKEARFLGRGTGWVLDAERGLVVTNFHVINGARAFEVQTDDGVKQRAEVVGAAPCEDLAVLRVSQGEGLRTMPLGSQREVAEGDPVVAVGFPVNAANRDTLTATAGVVSVARTRIESPSADAPSYPNMVQTDAALGSGNSGGPLLDRRNRLVGVNTAMFGGSHTQPVQGQGYAIGVDRVKQVVRDLSRGRSRGWAGIGVAAPPRGYLASRRLPQGILAMGTVPGTPAQRAGLDRGPVLITAINGTRLDSRLESYCAAVRGVRSGQTAALSVISGSRSRSRRVRLAFE